MNALNYAALKVSPRFANQTPLKEHAPEPLRQLEGAILFADSNLDIHALESLLCRWEAATGRHYPAY